LGADAGADSGADLGAVIDDAIESEVQQAVSQLSAGAGNVTANGQRLRRRYGGLGIAPPSWLGAGG